jgi:hypothetical protein
MLVCFEQYFYLLARDEVCRWVRLRGEGGGRLQTL